MNSIKQECEKDVILTTKAGWKHNRVNYWGNIRTHNQDGCLGDAYSNNLSRLYDFGNIINEYDGFLTCTKINQTKSCDSSYNLNSNSTKCLKPFYSF